MDIDDTVDAFTKEYNTKYEKTYLQLIVHSVLNEFKKSFNFAHVQLSE